LIEVDNPDSCFGRIIKLALFLSTALDYINKKLSLSIGFCGHFSRPVLTGLFRKKSTGRIYRKNRCERIQDPDNSVS
jgi:hypothetical protein